MQTVLQFVFQIFQNFFSCFLVENYDLTKNNDEPTQMKRMIACFPYKSFSKKRTLFSLSLMRSVV